MRATAPSSIGLLVSAALSAPLAAQDAAVLEEFVDWTSDHATTLPLDPDADWTALVGPFEQLLGNARVLALGEPFHNGREPLDLRNRLIRLCVEQLRCAAVALETGLSDSKLLYDYVLGRTDAPDSVLIPAFSNGFGRYPQNQELLKWLRDFNSRQPDERKVRLYGVDLSGAARSIEGVLSFLEVSELSLEGAEDVALRPLLSELGDAFPRLGVEEQDRLTGAVIDLVAGLRRDRVRFQDVTSSDEFDWALQQAVNAAYGIDELRRTDLDEVERMLSGTSRPEDRFDQAPFRDLAIAENVIWVAERERSRGRVLFFAHNHHVQAHEAQQEWGSRFAAAWNGVPVAGAHLRALLGDDLVVIGTQFGGTIGFPNDAAWQLPEGDALGLGELLGMPGLPAYLVDLRQMPRESSLWEWLSQPHATRPWVGGVSLVRPTEAFDAIIYVDRITPSLRPN